MPHVAFQEALQKAIRAKDLDLVKHWLANGADASWRDTCAGTSSPMEQAAGIGFVEGIETLHAAGAKMDEAGNAKNTPFIRAAMMNKVEAGRWLLRHGANERAINESNDSALRIALTYRHFDFADMMLDERPDCRGDYLLGIAQAVVYRKDLDTGQWLLQHGIGADLVGDHGEPWLAIVQTRDAVASSAFIDLLLAAGADVNARNAMALHRAVDVGTIPVFVNLLRAGANPDLPGQSGKTVRETLEQSPDHQGLLEVFRAWEASQSAQKIIEDTAPKLGLLPLS